MDTRRSADRQTSPPISGHLGRGGTLPPLFFLLGFQTLPNCLRHKNSIFRFLIAVVLSAGVTVFFSTALHAQSLVPRAYLITPVHSNAVVVTDSFSNGSLLFNNVLPITDAKAKINVSVLSYYRTLSFFGRSANITASLPYAVGSFQGTVFGTTDSIYRSGLGDCAFRFSVNLIGGPAMSAKQFQSWKQKRLLGVSITVLAPTGQYDPTKLINIGANRWGFKPELGYSRRKGNWVLEAYGGVWFFTTNPQFFSNNAFVSTVQVQTQKPIGAFEGHIGYDIKPRLWVSFDANFWFGGPSSLNGLQNPATFQVSSRIGGTASIPLAKHQSMKFSYSDGAYIRVGGNYQTVSVAWQYSWLGKFI
jgi:hypothetical protein